ncbi:MAG: phage portal protein [Alphaproteobacteria bacterium]|nr:phage portal protein [Alphaproteobacteria bacterium]
MKSFLRPKSTAAQGQPAQKASRASPMIAWSHVGQPQWTPRKSVNLAEEGFRKNSVAYRCVMHIATACAAVPWLLYDAHGHEIDTHPLLDLLAHPNPLQDGVSFMENIYANLQISGNAYIEAIRPRDDAAPIELYSLRPDRMKIVPGPSGMPQAYQYSVNGQTTTWNADPVTGDCDILHLKTFNPLDDWYGLAPMEAALLSIDQHNAAGAWNQALLNQGARPSGALIYAPKDGGPSTLSDDQMQRLREEMGMLYQGDRNAGRPLILEGGLDWREMSLSPKDMDWLAGRSAAARDIALAFGIPAQLIGIPDAQTYANVEQARLAFYEETALPLVTRIIAGVDHWLSPMFETRDGIPELDFDPDAIPALTDKRQAQWDKLQNATFLTPNEKRQAAGYGPIPGGDSPGGINTGGINTGGENDGDENSAADDGLDGPHKEAGHPAAFFNVKFNPYRDPTNGQFTFGPGDRLVQEIPPIEELPPPMEEPEVGAPKPSPNFAQPTNPPQEPPTDIPDGWRVRKMDPTEQYPNGYWKLEKPMDNGGWQPINPSTMKPGTRPETHIPFPSGALTG